MLRGYGLVIAGSCDGSCRLSETGTTVDGTGRRRLYNCTKLIDAMGDELSASEYFICQLTSQVHTEKVEKLIFSQREALARFEKTNEMLSNCLNLSASRLEIAQHELLWYTQLVTEMKKDLDSIYRRIRVFKNSLSRLYPNAFSQIDVNTTESNNGPSDPELQEVGSRENDVGPSTYALNVAENQSETSEKQDENAKELS